MAWMADWFLKPDLDRRQKENMGRYRRIVWNEGMLLTPHHFQQSDNYYEELLNSRLASLFPYDWGVLEININREALSNGLFELTRCHLVMPDGLLLNLPETQVLPEARPVDGHFDPAEEKLNVSLAIPSLRIGAANYQTNGAEHSTNVRFLQDAADVVDETTGDNWQQIAYARGNLRILFGAEQSEGYTSIKIAEIKRTTTGQLSLSDRYIPPALSIGASPWVMNMLRQIIEILVTKSTTHGNQRRQRGNSLADFTGGDIALFWLLHTVNTAIPKFTHLFRTRIVHPERLYSEMSSLVGSLMTFAVDRHPKSIVAYDHTNLYFTFTQLAAQIRDLLDTVIPTKCIQIPLKAVRESIYFGRVVDERLLKDAAFILGIQAKLPDAHLLQRVPRIVKIASLDDIDVVVGSALPGVSVRNAAPPPSVPVRAGFHYFKLDSNGGFWEKIRGSKTISLYVPAEFPDVKLELYAVKP